jgi:hypothetical protein
MEGKMFNGGSMWKCSCGRASYAGPICPTCSKGASQVREAITKALAESGSTETAVVDLLMRRCGEIIEQKSERHQLQG